MAAALSTREKTLLDAAGALEIMAQDIEKTEGVAANAEVVPGGMRWAYRLGQAAGWRYAAEVITETLSNPTLKAVD